MAANKLNILSHPVINAELSKLRQTSTTPKEFREGVETISLLLGYEATRTLEEVPFNGETPVAPFTGSKIKPRIGLTPILRAGLGMTDALLKLFPYVLIRGEWPCGQGLDSGCYGFPNGFVALSMYFVLRLSWPRNPLYFIRFWAVLAVLGLVLAGKPVLTGTWVWVQVGAKIPAGYLCHCLPEAGSGSDIFPYI